MVVIDLTAEQEKLIEASGETVYVRASSGSLVGCLSLLPKGCPFTPEDIEKFLLEAKSDKTRYTTAQVLERLKELEAAGK